jgi:2-keto-3-deoxy-L-arabinonate dehydratase
MAPRGVSSLPDARATALAASKEEILVPATAAAPFRGIFPIAPTPFTEAGEVDLDGQRRVLDCMIDQGVDGICILANYSEQFLLTDDERNTLVDLCLAHVNDRVPVIVTCSHFSTQIAVARASKAANAGAAMLMMMPPYHGPTFRGVAPRKRASTPQFTPQSAAAWRN